MLATLGGGCRIVGSCVRIRGVETERASVEPPAAAAPPALDAVQTLERFIGHLRARCLSLREGGQVAAGGGAGFEANLPGLYLSQAAVRSVTELQGAAARPPQVAILGPTQTGKSTVANLLTGGTVAEVSPLAGYTAHPQGIWLRGAQDDERWVASLFPGWRRCEPAGLTRDDLKTFSLTTVGARAGTSSAGGAEGDAALPACVVWDTPDFDSVVARRYAPGVLETAALADVYVLVLSKEKYSDLSVWHLLELLEPLQRPLLICVNKLTPDAEEAVLRSLRGRLAERGRGWGEVPLVPLPYDAALAAGKVPAGGALVRSLRQAVGSRLAEARTESAGRRVAGVQALVRKHWEAWLSPVRAEHAAREEWQASVARAGTQFMEAYERDYLNHPQRYDSFRRASLALLDLLEIPHVGGMMSRARRVLTWPARQVLSWGRSLGGGGSDQAPVHSLGAEATVLVDALATLLTGVQRDIVRRCSPTGAAGAFWLALERKLDADLPRLNQAFEAAIETHHAQVTHEIRAAANSLYEALQKQPARLAALRTARATFDVGSILLLVKTGGLTPLDAVWAPATFAVTSLVMEGMAGLEMQRVSRQLKTRQQAAVQEELVQKTLVRELNALSHALDDAGLLGVTPQEVAQAEAALATWEAEG